MTKKTFLAEAAEKLVEQMRKLGNFQNQEQAEQIRKDADAASKSAFALAKIAEVQVKIYFAAGFLPADQFLVTEDDAKLINSSGIIRLSSRKQKGKFLDEFVKEQ